MRRPSGTSSESFRPCPSAPSSKPRVGETQLLLARPAGRKICGREARKRTSAMQRLRTWAPPRAGLPECAYLRPLLRRVDVAFSLSEAAVVLAEVCGHLD